MTDPKLLPLYAELQGHPKIEIIKHYARACVAHATEPMRAHRERLTLHVLDLEADRSGLIGACDEYRQRAERLAEALRELRDLMLGQVKWMPCDCGCPQQRTPDGPHSATWLRAAQQVEIAIGKAEAEDRG